MLQFRTKFVMNDFFISSIHMCQQASQQSYFGFEGAKTELHMEIRKALMNEALRIGEIEGVDVADMLNNMVFAVDEVFEKFQ